jgi:hypothetical protein
VSSDVHAKGHTQPSDFSRYSPEAEESQFLPSQLVGRRRSTTFERFERAIRYGFISLN